MWRKGNTLALLVEMQTVTVTLEDSMEVPQETKNRTSLQSSNCTIRYLPKGYKNTDLKEYMHPNVYSSIISNRQSMERAQISIDCWMEKEDVVYIHNGILLSHKKNEILPFAMMWMELEYIMLSEISLSQRKANTIWLHSYVEFKKQNRWTYRKGRGIEKRGKQTTRDP